MNESQPHDTNPFESLVAQDFEPPVWADLPQDMLDQLNAEDGPGIVAEPVPQRDYASVSELIPDYSGGELGHTNITLYFGPHDSIYFTLNRQFNVKRRFAILYPELDNYLTEKMHNQRLNVPRELHEPIFKAYKLMRHLVDANDPYVRKPDGSLDDNLLIR